MFMGAGSRRRNSRRQIPRSSPWHHVAFFQIMFFVKLYDLNLAALDPTPLVVRNGPILPIAAAFLRHEHSCSASDSMSQTKYGPRRGGFVPLG